MEQHERFTALTHRRLDPMQDVEINRRIHGRLGKSGNHQRDAIGAPDSAGTPLTPTRRRRLIAQGLHRPTHRALGLRTDKGAIMNHAGNRCQRHFGQLRDRLAVNGAIHTM